MLLDSNYVGNAFSTHKYISEQTDIVHYPSLPPSLLMPSKCYILRRLNWLRDRLKMLGEESFGKEIE